MERAAVVHGSWRKRYGATPQEDLLLGTLQQVERAARAHIGIGVSVELRECELTVIIIDEQQKLLPYIDIY